MRPIPENRSFTLRLRVTSEMTARFFDTAIHPVYATFAVVEHAEYAARCAILPYLEPHEDAVGGAVSIQHFAPARVGEIVEIEARVIEVGEREIICSISARTGEGEIASGTQMQRVVLKERVRERFS